MKIFVAFLLCAVAGMAADKTWQQTLAERVPVYGHRNWIVIADSAYPEQAREGIQTIVANADQLEVLKTVLVTLGHSKHVTPVIFTDQELGFLDDAEAPGIESYRKKLDDIFQGRSVDVLPHEKIIDKLDQVSQTFKVLIIKTNMTLPYTSVFLQLDCAYWGPDAESNLRAKMRGAGVH
jgi:L-fucose mutarotase/ribose pyranase (RbsD/FucU family)